MRRTVKVLILVALLGTTAVAHGAAADTSESGASIGQEIKEGTTKIGHAVRDGAVAIGHGVRNTAVAVGHGSKKAWRAAKSAIHRGGATPDKGSTSPAATTEPGTAAGER
jgi:hypothetical protein